MKKSIFQKIFGSVKKKSKLSFCTPMNGCDNHLALDVEKYLESKKYFKHIQIAENAKQKVYLLNYSDDRYKRSGGHFRKNQLAINKSAIQNPEFGVTDIISWTFKDLQKTYFYKNNKEFLDKHRIENGVPWKSFIIFDLLHRINYGDIIFYYDCGPHPLKTSIKKIIGLCNKNQIVIHNSPFLQKEHTKRDAFVLMNCDVPEQYTTLQIQNTWIFFKKTNFNILFVKEWLKYNLDERIVSYVKPNTCNNPNLKDFEENRGDQTIFSLLCHKYNIKAFSEKLKGTAKDVNNFANLLGTKNRLLPSRIRNFITNIIKIFICR